MPKLAVHAAIPLALVATLVTSGCGGGGAETGGPDGGADGCGQPPTIALATWVERSVQVPGGGTRAYFVRLPDGYDPDVRYPVVYQLHGCSDAREANNVPVENASGAAAIHVRGRADDRCWDTATGGPDVPYLDAMVEAIEAAHCTDPDRRFATGYSSGSFMANRLACIRGDLLRGVATIAGGPQGGGVCDGTVAALLIHDADDMQVVLPTGLAARDAYVAANGCDQEMPTVPVEPAPCVAYQGCDADAPVVWCETEGNDHDRQDGFAAPVFWGFLSGLD
jgi:polyhydroxybutyrate depolymerase